MGLPFFNSYKINADLTLEYQRSLIVLLQNKQMTGAKVRCAFHGAILLDEDD
jgi:hypothetical protein